MATALSERTDEELALRARTEPGAAFEALFERYRGPLHSFLRRQGADPSRVEDLFQQTFLKAFRAIGQFREDARFKTWFYTIAAHVLADEGRLAARRGRASELREATAVEAPTQAERAEQAEALDRVKEALGQLTPGHRMLFTLVRFQGLPIAEAAGVVGMTPGAAKVTLFRVSKWVGEQVSPVKERTSHGL